MNELVFIKRNKKDWNRFESYLKGNTDIEVDELGDLYLKVSGDLSFARTYYPQSEIVSYLNSLALQLHQKIYKNKKESKGRVWKFWSYEVPCAVGKSHQELLIAFTVFAVAIMIGVFSTVLDIEYFRHVLGDSYVNTTDNNIAEGDPLGIYRSASETSMFFGISSNNIRVSFIAFVIGIFGSFMTGLLLFYNGIMVGTFVNYFFSKGIGMLAFTTIMIHGTLELSAIVIAGCAGMVLGNGLFFPGSLPRKESLVLSARRSMKIIIGLVPVFVIAGFLESYVTRHYIALGWVGRWIIVLLSAAFIIWYFIILPRQTVKNGK